MVILDESGTHIAPSSPTVKTRRNPTTRSLKFNSLYDDLPVTTLEESERHIKVEDSHWIASRADLESRSTLNLNEEDERFDENEVSVVTASELPTNITCNTPDKFRNDSNCLCTELDSFKFGYPKKVQISDTSEEDIRKNIEERNLISKYIGKTVSGWDRHGMHYWLHKVSKSNLHLPLIEEIGRESWYHIHVCDNCVKKLNIPHEFCFMLPDTTHETDNDSILSASNFAGENGLNSEMQNDNLNDFKSLAIVGSGNNGQSTNQYFQRAVYCYNTCGLNFELFDKKQKAKVSGIQKNCTTNETNPFIKVVVIGTDPCGLKFPIEIDDKESSTKGVAENQLLLPNCDENIEDVPHSAEYTNDLIVSTAQVQTNTLNKTFQMLKESVRMVELDNMASTFRRNNYLKPQQIHQHGGKGLHSCKSTSSTFANYSTTATNSSVNTCSVLDLNDSITSQSCSVESDVYTQYSQSVSYFNTHLNNSLHNFKSIEKTFGAGKNINDVKKLNLSKNSKLSVHSSCSRIKFHGKKLSPHNKLLYNTLKLARGSKTGLSKNESLHQSHILSLRHNSHTKKRRTPLLMQFPENEAMKLRMIYFGKRCDKILLGAQSKNQLKSSFFKFPRLRTLLIIIFFFVFFLGGCMLIEDALQPLPEPVNNWYLF